MKLVVDHPITQQPMVATSTNNVTLAAQALMNFPGVGKPFLMFASLSNDPPSTVLYDLHEDWASKGNKVTNNLADNVAIINAMLAEPPTDALVYS